jgi:hypothetical protein
MKSDKAIDRGSLALADLGPFLLPDDEQIAALRSVLAAARAISDPSQRCNVLVVLAPLLPETERKGALRDALAAAGAIRDGDKRTFAFKSLTLLLTDDERKAALREAVAAAKTITSDMRRSTTLGFILAPLLEETERKAALRDALAAAKAVRNAGMRAFCIEMLAPLLPPAELEAALRAELTGAKAISNNNKRAEVMFILAPLLPAGAQCAIGRRPGKLDARATRQALGSASFRRLTQARISDGRHERLAAAPSGPYRRDHPVYRMTAWCNP